MSMAKQQERTRRKIRKEYGTGMIGREREREVRKKESNPSCHLIGFPACKGGTFVRRAG